MIAAARLATLLLLYLGCLSGCGQDRINAQPVYGRVTVANDPLSHGVITFRPIGSTRGPQCLTNIRDGAFEFKDQQGPWPGEHLILIEEIPPGEAAIMDGESHESAMQKAKLPYRRIAEEFNSRSILRAQIKEGERNQCNFEVQWRR